MRKEIDDLYRQAAVATDAYNLAEEKSKEQSAEIVRVNRLLTEGREKIDGLKAKAGAAARSQYRNGGLPEARSSSSPTIRSSSSTRQDASRTARRPPRTSSPR